MRKDKSHETKRMLYCNETKPTKTLINTNYLNIRARLD